MEKQKILTPIKAIRAKCLDCSCGNPYEVEKCVIPNCPLYPYRLGKNPNRSNTLTEEQKAAAGERLKRINEQRKAEKAAASVSDTSLRS